MIQAAALALSMLGGGLTPGAVQEPPATPVVEAVVETSAGSFTIRLLSELAPRHVTYFVETAETDGYDGTTFHRIIPRGIIQGGDPLTRDPAASDRYGTGGLGVLKAEFSDRPMTRGSVAAVLRPNKPDSAGSQFFVVLFDQLALTGQFTIFGEVVEGMEVADAIGQTPVDGDRATERVEILDVTIRRPSPPAHQSSDSR